MEKHCKSTHKRKVPAVFARYKTKTFQSKRTKTCEVRNAKIFIAK
jgi:hypothetical protein